MRLFKFVHTAILPLLCALLLTITARADVAAIAAPDRPAATVAEQVLRSGGNAVDAAVAVGFALSVEVASPRSTSKASRISSIFARRRPRQPHAICISMQMAKSSHN
jgi:hypothetical protein